jgi:5'-3' exonuclease
MGIPSYFRKIVKEYPNVTFWDDNKSIDHFFIDFNAMIYSVILGIENSKKMSPSQFENKLLYEIIEQLEKLITKIIKPKKSLIIAMDGPPPRAKMIQQRNRRYKAIKENQFIKSMEMKYNCSIPKLSWSKSSISPGTVFMDRLSKKILYNIKNGKLHKHSNQKLEIIFSDSSIVGEGEHKILPLIKTLKKNIEKKDDTIAIYSPDADMIILSIITHKNNIYILKEDENENSKNKYLYLSIDLCNKYFKSEIQSQYRFKNNNIDNCFLIDYSFLTFLCGNDFVIPSPFIKMKENGLNYLLKIYNDLLEDDFLINNNVINLNFFKKIINELSKIELNKLQNTQKKMHLIMKGKNRNDGNKNKNNKEPWEDELIRFQHEYYYSPMHPKCKQYKQIFYSIDYFKEDWENDYNKHFFGFNKKDKNYHKKINQICEDYYKSLVFCLKYYLINVPSWTWFYPHRAPPTFQEFNNYLKSKSNDSLNLLTIFDKGTPFSPFEQLLLILPKQSMNLLPSEIKIPSKLKKFYPSSFKLDILLGGKYIYSEPILPEIDTSLIKDLINTTTFKNVNKSRNKIRKNPITITISKGLQKRITKKCKL